MKKTLKKILGSSLSEIISKTIISYSIKRVVKESKRSNLNAEDAIELLFSKKGKFIRPWQHRKEILELAKLLEARKPKTILEIGTASGGTLFLSALLADSNALIVSIDLEFGMYGGGYPSWKIPLYNSFAKNNQKIELIRGDSHSKLVKDQFLKTLHNKKIDYLFIDGDHTYEGVKEDFEFYSKYLSDNAIVAFHDIVSDKAENPDHFVSVLWNEIKNKYPHFEFINDSTQSKLGLGVLIIKNL